MAVYFAQFGVPVSFTGAPAGALGIVDVATQEMLVTDAFPGVLGTQRVVTLGDSAAALAAALTLRIDDPITVAGVKYTIGHRAQIDDGKVLRVWLQDEEKF
jgi:hypothetical protein